MPGTSKRTCPTSWHVPGLALLRMRKRIVLWPATRCRIQASSIHFDIIRAELRTFQRLARHTRGLLAKQRRDVLPAFRGGNSRRRVAELVLKEDASRRVPVEKKAHQRPRHRGIDVSGMQRPTTTSR